MRILYCGERAGNSLSRFESFQKLGHLAQLVAPEDYLYAVPSLWRRVEWRLRDGVLVHQFNQALLRIATSIPFDMVWIEKGMLVYADTLRQIKRQTQATLVASHSDDFLDKSSNKISRHFDEGIPIYDIIFTPRDINYLEMRKLGAKHVSKFWKGYDEEAMKPWPLTSAESSRFQCDVMFIGHYEQFRFSCLEKLLRKGVALKVGGSTDLWNKHWPTDLPFPHIGAAEGREFGKAHCGAKIGLNFLSRWARDTQNSRAFEIPATGTFMLCERTKDLTNCFVEGVEADFFSDANELLEKVAYYLENASLRREIAANGLKKSCTAGYSNYARTKAMLDEIAQFMNGT